MTHGRERRIVTETAPAAIGPYNQATVAGDFLFISGQLPLTTDGALVTSSIADAARQAIENVKAIATAAGSYDIVQVRAYLTEMNDYAEFNEVYAQQFTEPYPARAVVAVAGLPKGAPVEIEATAVRRGQ